MKSELQLYKTFIIICACVPYKTLCLKINHVKIRNLSKRKSFPLSKKELFWIATLCNFWVLEIQVGANYDRIFSEITIHHALVNGKTLKLENDLWHAFVKKTVLCMYYVDYCVKMKIKSFLQKSFVHFYRFSFLKLRIDAKENKPIKLSCQDAASGWCISLPLPDQCKKYLKCKEP